MPTSATCPRTDRRRRAGGFTLLELLVVLSILGLATALAAPAVVRSIDSWRRQAEVDAVLDQVRGLPARARASGRNLRIDDESLAAPGAPLVAPEGWQLSVPEAWQVRANGVCAGGDLDLQAGERVVRVEVASPFCEPRIVDEG